MQLQEIKQGDEAEKQPLVDEHAPNQQHKQLVGKFGGERDLQGLKIDELLIHEP